MAALTYYRTNEHKSIRQFTNSKSLCMVRIATFLCLTSLIRSSLSRPPAVAVRAMSQFTTSANNPLLAPFTKFGGMPPFGEVKSCHYKPAFDVAMATHLVELKTIAESPDSPTFANTIEAFDKCGSLLMQVGKVYYNLCSSDCPPELQAVQTEMAAPLAQHKSATYMFSGLFDRIDRVHDSRGNAGLNPEELRLVERIHLDFVRAGAKFDADAQARYKKIMTDLAEMTTKFTQNILGGIGDRNRLSILRLPYRSSANRFMPPTFFSPMHIPLFSSFFLLARTHTSPASLSYPTHPPSHPPILPSSHPPTPPQTNRPSPLT